MSSLLLSVQEVPDQCCRIHQRLLMVQERLNMAAEFLELADKHNETVYSMGALSAMLGHLSLDISEIRDDLRPLPALPVAGEAAHV